MFPKNVEEINQPVNTNAKRRRNTGKKKPEGREKGGGDFIILLAKNLENYRKPGGEIQWIVKEKYTNINWKKKINPGKKLWTAE